MEALLKEISKCAICDLELGPRPVVTAYISSKIVIIGQAPGKIVHRTGIPWNDKSGENLRNWMGIDNYTFYDTEKIAILPMGFCYPGKGKTGDLPPLKECAPLWHHRIMNELQHVELVLLIGKYAQDYYLKENSKNRLTDTVKDFKKHLPKYFVLPHPSPRNNIWQAKNKWFAEEVLPELKKTIQSVLEA